MRKQRADRCIPEKAQKGIALILHLHFTVNLLGRICSVEERQGSSMKWWSSGLQAASSVWCIHIETQRRKPCRKGRKQRRRPGN